MKKQKLVSVKKYAALCGVKLAKKYGHDKMIFVGVSVGTYTHEGMKVFRTGATNIWD